MTLNPFPAPRDQHVLLCDDARVHEAYFHLGTGRFKYVDQAVDADAFKPTGWFERPAR